jgi:hypothetical protein
MPKKDGDKDKAKAAKAAEKAAREEEARKQAVRLNPFSARGARQYEYQ